MARFNEKIKSEFDSVVLDIRRVTRVIAGGKRFSFRATVVAGNRNGKVGVGLAKGLDVAQSVEKAIRDAKKNIVEVSITNGTIPHESYAKYSSAKVLLKPAGANRGIKAGGAVRAVCNLAGIKNITSKIIGRTTNKLTNARATIEALKKLKVKSEKVKTDADTPIKNNL